MVLCRELAARGWRVRALVRPGRAHTHLAGSVAEIRTGDILAPESLEGLSDGAASFSTSRRSGCR
jgi:uncharacterized protein YbjT (DUF2867 family)